MKRGLALLLACVMALSLAACGAKTPSAETPKAETGTTQGAENTPAAEPQPQPQETAQPLPERTEEVEGNGGFFVRVGDKVWFRRYDDGAGVSSAFWGEFLSVAPEKPAASKLCYYDRKGDAVIEAMSDDGFGELWFGVDGFYLTRAGQNDDLHHAYFRAVDGAVTELCDGEISGVSDNGCYAAVSTWGPPADGAGIRVYEGTKEVRTVPILDDGPRFLAVCDDGAVVYRDANKVCELDASGKTLVLGTLPEPEADYELWWEFERSLINGDELWLTFGAYEGTGHFLSETLCVRMKLGTENSLEAIEDQPTSEEPYVPKLMLDGGEVRRVEYLPDETDTSYSTGDLLRFGTDGSAGVLVGGFLSTLSYDEEERRVVQASATLGDTVYLIVAQAFRDSENDVGWRMAYRPGELYYVAVPLREGADVETLIGPEYIVYPPDNTVYQSFAGRWQLFATEVEGDRNDTLTEGTWELLEIYEDGSALITGSDYQNRFTSADVLPTGGVGDGDSEYGLLITGGTNDDMLWVYYEGDTLVATVMIHFIADGATDSFSRTGFYSHAEY